METETDKLKQIRVKIVTKRPQKQKNKLQFPYVGDQKSYENLDQYDSNVNTIFLNFTLWV